MESRIRIQHYTGKMPQIFIRFYLVGLLLYMIPYTRPLFVSITSLSLFLATAVVLAFHKDWSVKTVIWFAFIVLSSFLLEMQGVESGELFGQYVYEQGLAPMINDTPLIIGFNWLFLVYASNNIVSRWNSKAWMRILSGSLLMIFYDFFLEWVAPYMTMWRFESGYAPFQNFLVWFLAALFYHTGFEVLKIKSDNPPSRFLFGLQILFFVVIGIYSVIFIR